jgi:hypothetical protein
VCEFLLFSLTYSIFNSATLIFFSTYFGCFGHAVVDSFTGRSKICAWVASLFQELANAAPWRHHKHQTATNEDQIEPKNNNKFFNYYYNTNK